MVRGPLIAPYGSRAVPVGRPPGRQGYSFSWAFLHACPCRLPADGTARPWPVVMGGLGQGVAPVRAPCASCMATRAGCANRWRRGRHLDRAADANRSVITVLARDLGAGPTTRVLSARAPRRGQVARWQAVLEGPGVAAGSMTLARTIAPGDTAIVLLIAGPEFEGVRTPLQMEEARALVAAMRRSAVAVLTPSRPAPPAARRPPPPPR